MIPLWFWPALAVVCLLILAEAEVWQANRKVENFRAVEAERIARKNAAPLGNADRVYDRAKDLA